MLLKDERLVYVVAEAGTVLETIEVIKKYKPDVVLFEEALPGMSDVDFFGLLNKHSASTKLLILTASSVDATMLKTLKAGARGFLTKTSNLQAVTKAIQKVHEGELWIERTMITRIFAERDNPDPENAEKRTKMYLLTKREQQVLRLLASGDTNKNIEHPVHQRKNGEKPFAHHL